MGRAVIYLDANVMIRLVEGDAAVRQPLEARLSTALGVPDSMVTSRLTRLECRSKPLQLGDARTVQKYDAFLSGVELLVTEVSADVIELATDLRAKYRLESPDAIHFSTAIIAGAVLFLTGDRAFSRCSELPVKIL